MMNQMRILFICGSAEPGRDGVGDYTRRLCGELNRSGHEAQILSLCDKLASSFTIEDQLLEDASVVVRRIPIGTSNKQRLVWTEEVLQEVAPDWISLQYVPYSFHHKGLPFWLPRFLKKLEKNHRWHVMFHELWLGIKHDASYKDKVYGFFQRNIIYLLCKSVIFESVHTSTSVYKEKLSKIDISSLLLNLFGNIPIIKKDKIVKDTNVLNFIYFGGLHNEGDEVLFLNNLSAFLKSKSIDFQINFVGNTGPKIDDWLKTANSLGIRINVLGLKTASEISEILLASDYGITTNPSEFMTKSGTVASMVEHGLSIVSARESCKPSYFSGNLPFLFYNNQSDLNLLIKTKKQKAASTLTVICKEFLGGLNQ
jgi:hypothetical protein